MDAELKAIEAESRSIKVSPALDTLDEKHWERIDRLYKDYLLIEEMKREQGETNYSF